ncbi:MAG: hypothetical protein M1831_001087 [Alyxoria varia]|nr:MAG: hypothetical protein M1831_001087 [Alyxoria varia]
MAGNDLAIDDLVNLEGMATPAKSPLPKAEPQFENARRVIHQQDHSERQFYSGPSHDYGQFKQQTGLPTGAMSQLPAANDFNGQIGPPSFVASQLPGYGSGINLDGDMDVGSPSDITSFGYYGYSPNNDFADGGAADAGSAVRAWPGMHSQQAENAKAEALLKEQRQREQQETQQRQQSQQSLMSQQQPLPANFRETLGSIASGAGGSDQIARLLNNVRNQSPNSIADDDNASMNGGSFGSRRKDGEAMDEDERLLASEEGKKLSSKERRQLRNKVSARAFRSRRKEYISQLEGEVAAKNDENIELRKKNHFLTQQNQQLISLTQTVIRHPAFRAYLAESSNDPSIMTDMEPTSSNTETTPTTQAPSTQQPTSRPVEQAASNINANAESNLNISMLNLGPSHWNDGNTQMNFQQPQVFAVHEIPSPPMQPVLPGDLSDKKGCATGALDCLEIAEKDEPSAKELCKSSAEPAKHDKTASLCDEEPEFDDPEFPLFCTTKRSDSAAAETARAECSVSQLRDGAPRVEQSFGDHGITRTRSTERKHGNDATTNHEIDELFASLEPLSRRIDETLMHISQ